MPDPYWDGTAKEVKELQQRGQSPSRLKGSPYVEKTCRKCWRKFAGVPNRVNCEDCVRPRPDPDLDLGDDDRPRTYDDRLAEGEEFLKDDE